MFDLFVTLTVYIERKIWQESNDWTRISIFYRKVCEHLHVYNVYERHKKIHNKLQLQEEEMTNNAGDKNYDGQYWINDSPKRLIFTLGRRKLQELRVVGFLDSKNSRKGCSFWFSTVLNKVVHNFLAAHKMLRSS